MYLVTKIHKKYGTALVHLTLQTFVSEVGHVIPIARSQNTVVDNTRTVRNGIIETHASNCG